ncbi:bis(5'-nucleosyl)-tetraphosphatase [Clostridium sp.]|uniref:bis(5'-nucleosyl)-tetraphosphatase n=1 Tax=Clostridium sp. TaxID=1506 RepID=UPI003D6D77AF
MNMEKSCGAVIYRKLGEEFSFLAVKSKANGHWSFPKGHMEEKDENEKETARREVLEETGLSITLLDEFRTKIEYQLTESTLKEVIFFIGITSEQSVNIQQEEIEEFRWLNYKDMLDLLTFENSKKILIEVKDFLNKLAS